MNHCLLGCVMSTEKCSQSMDFGKDEEWNWQRRVLKKPATTSAQTVTGLRFQHDAACYEAGVPLPAWWGCPVRNFMNFFFCISVFTSDTVTTTEIKTFRSCTREGCVEVLNILYVAGSILDGIIGILHRLNPSGSTMVLGSIQLLKDGYQGYLLGVKVAGA